MDDFITIEEIEAQTKEPQPVITAFIVDESATWVYWTTLDTAERGISDEWVWERLRVRRDQLLYLTDYRMTVDAPWNNDAWAIYRQALRDLPNNTSDPKLAEWPVAPNE